MRKPILVPELGLPNLVLSVWFVKPGERVFAGDRVVELLAGSATIDVTSEAAGTLEEFCAWPGDALEPQQVLGFVEMSTE